MALTDEGNHKLLKCLTDQLYCGLVFPNNLSMSLPSHSEIYSNILAVLRMPRLC